MPARFYPGEVVRFKSPQPAVAAFWGEFSYFVVSNDPPMPNYHYRVYNMFDPHRATFSVRHNELELIEND